jgi:hypothetical protein
MKHVNMKWVIVYFLTLLLHGCRKNEDKTYSRNIDPPVTAIVHCSGRPIINANLVPVGSISLERSAIKSATAGNKILFVGGNNSNPYTYPSLVVDIYDFVADTWTTTSLKGNYREGCAITSLGDKIFIAGGSDYMDASRVDIYDASSNSWSEARLSMPRTGLAAGSAGNKVVFAGGETYDDIFPWDQAVDIYDIQTDRWTTARLSVGRSQISATTLDNKIYFAGGQTGLAFFDNVDIYDASTNSWDTSHLAARKGRVSSIAAGNSIYWAGGLWFATNAAMVACNKVEIKDLNTGHTSLECNLPSYDFSSVKNNDNIVFFTGNMLDDGHTYFEIFNIGTQQWSTGKLNYKITGASVICANNTIYVAGGNDGAGTHYKQVWNLEF